MTFLAYLLTRLFTNLKEIRVEGDEARHLKTAKTFYKMWNNSFYDFHPPLYSLLIKIIGFVMPKYMAGILISFASSLGLYWITAKLYAALGLSPYATSIALTFMAFNYTLIYFSNSIFRYQLFAFLFTCAFYYLYTGHYLVAGLFWGATLLTCSFNGLRFFWVWLVLLLCSKAYMGSFQTILVAYYIYIILWILPKLILYSSTKYHPSGTEGRLERVDKFNFKQLLTPMYFPFSYAYYGSKYLRKDIRYWHTRIMGIFGLYPVSIFLSIPYIFMAWWTVKGLQQGPLWLVSLTLLLLMPSFDFKYRPRNSVMVIPLIGYFLGVSMSWLHPQWLLFAQIGGLGAFLWHNRRPITSVGIKPIASVTSRILDKLPLDGILAEGYSAYPIAYNSKKRVVVCTHNPDETQAYWETHLAIFQFNLNYFVYSDKWILDCDIPYPVIEQLKKTVLLKTIREDGTEYYIHNLRAYDTERTMDHEVFVNSTHKEVC